MAVRAMTRNFGMSPKKVRRYLALIRGKRVNEAVATLMFMPSPAAVAVRKTLQSAVANAENNHLLDAADLKVTRAYADDGLKLPRMRPQARGRGAPVIRRFCHISVIVEEATLGGT